MSSGRGTLDSSGPQTLRLWKHNLNFSQLTKPLRYRRQNERRKTSLSIPLTLIRTKM